MRTPQDAAKEFILNYEGNSKVGYLSLDPGDSGNFYKGRLIGSNYGVTGNALAKFRKIITITPAMMKAVKLEEAVKIALQDYYIEPGFSALAWAPSTEALFDHGWLSGPVGAVMLMQRNLGVAADAVVGPFTQKAYEDWLGNGDKFCTMMVAKWRIARFDTIVRNNPAKRTYYNGWKKRAYAFTDANLVWWKKWTV